MIAKVQAYLEAGDLTQDELALIAEYVKRDLGNYDEGRKDEQVEESAFMLALKDTAWSWLADVTDRTQVEWQELADELEHKGSTGLATGWGSGYWCAITASGAIPCYILSSSAPVPSAGPMSITVSHSLLSSQTVPSHKPAIKRGAQGRLLFIGLYDWVSPCAPRVGAGRSPTPSASSRAAMPYMGQLPKRR